MTLNYKLSIFNIKCDETEEGVVIFNSITSSIVFVKKKYLYLLNQKNINTNSNNKNEKIINDLYTTGLLVTVEKDELSKLKFYGNCTRYAKNDIMEITIVPTYACNMKCVYCFQKECTVYLSKAMEENIVKFIKNKLTSHSGLHITWFGGEPLLAINIIESISNDIMMFCQENEKTYSSSIITNGSLLNAANVDILLNFIQLVLLTVKVPKKKIIVIFVKNNRLMNMFLT